MLNFNQNHVKISEPSCIIFLFKNNNEISSVTLYYYLKGGKVFHFQKIHFVFFIFSYSQHFKNMVPKFQLDLIEFLKFLTRFSQNRFFKLCIHFDFKINWHIRLKFGTQILHIKSLPQRWILDFFLFWGVITYQMAEFSVKNISFHIKWAPQIFNRWEKIWDRSFILKLNSNDFFFQVIFSWVTLNTTNRLFPKALWQNLCFRLYVNIFASKMLENIFKNILNDVQKGSRHLLKPFF